MAFTRGSSSNNAPINWNDIINNNNAGNYGSAGGGQTANFQDFYQKIREQNEARNNVQKEDRNASIFDYLAQSSREASEAIRDAGGANTNFANAQDPVSKFFSFLPTLPLGMLGAPGEFAASAYESLSGRDLSTLDKETGKISGNDLTPEQRAAAGINAIIEGPMASVGGSGRVLGAGARAVGKTNKALGRTIDKILPAEGTGVIRKAAEEAGEAKPLAIGKQIGFDVMEEGGEEFVQSIAEDVRDKDHETNGEVNFGKALESFGWGALGGGLMSAAGQGAVGLMNRAENKRIAAQQQQQPQQQQQQQGNISPYQGADLPKVEAPLDDTYIPVAKEYRTEKMFDDGREQKGGLGATVIVGKRNLSTNQTILGTSDFISMWQAQGKEAHDWWCSKYGVSEDYMVKNIVLEPNLQKATDRLNALHSRYGKSLGTKFKTTKKRDPGTSKTHLIALDLIGFHAGSGMQLSTLTAQYANGDVDGDTGFIMDYSDDQGAFYPTQLFSDPFGNPSSILEYLPSMNSKKGIEKVRELAKNNLGAVLNNNADQSNYLVNNIAKARQDGDAAEKAAIALTQIRRDLLRTKNPNTGMLYTADEADYALSDFISDIFEAAGEADQIGTIIDESAASVERVLANQARITGNADSHEYPILDGDVSDLKSVGDLLNRLGMCISLSRVKSDETLRDNQVLKYQVSKHKETIDSQIDGLNAAGADKIHRLLANILRLENVGEDVQNTIRDFISLEIVSRLMSELELGTTLDNRLGGNISLDTLLNKYQEIHNDVVGKYNKAITSENTSDESISLFDLIQLKEISFENEGSIEYQNAMNSMFKTLKHERFDHYVYVAENSVYSGKSFYEVSVYTTEYGISNASLTGIGNSNSSVNEANFLRKMLNSRLNESTAVSSRIYREMDQLPKMSLEEAKKPSGYQKSSVIASAFVRTMSPEVMEFAHLQDWRVIMAGPYAKTIVEGDASDRCNLLMALSFQYKFRDVQALINEMNDPKSKLKVTKEQIAHAAAMVRDGSMVTELIVKQFIDNGHSELYNVMTSTDATYENKIDSFAKFGQLHKDTAISLLADAIRTDSSEMGLSSISQRLTKVNQESIMADKLDNGYWQQHAENLIEAIEEGTDQETSNDPMDTVINWVLDESVGHNIVFWQAFFNDAVTLSLKNAEKGTAAFTPTAMSQMVEHHMKGGTYSYLQNVMSNNLGEMSAETFATNRFALIDVLFNGKTIKVKKANGYAWVNAQKICDDLLGEGAVTVENGRLNIDQFKQVIREAPTILSNLMPEIATVAPTSKQHVVFANDGTPAESFRKYRTKERNYAQGKQTDVESNMLRWRLSNDVSFYSSLPGIMDLSNTSREHINEEVEKKSKLYIDHVMAYAKKIRDASNNSNIDVEEMIQIEKDQFRADMYASAANNIKDQLEKALTTVDYIARREASNSINIATTLTDPTNAASILLDDSLKAELFKAIDNNGLATDDQKNKLKDYIKAQDDKLDAEVYEKLVGGKDTAERISLDLISMMGTGAWKAYTKTRFAEDLFGINEKELNSSEAEAFRQIVDQWVDAIYEHITSIGRLSTNTDHIFDFECYDRDTLTVNQSAMEAKARVILDKYYDPDNKSAKQTLKEIAEYSAIVNNESLSTEERKEALDDLEEVRKEIVNASLTNGLRRVGSFGDSTPNYDAYFDADIFYKNFWDTVENIAFETDDKGYKYHLSQAPEVQDLDKMTLHFANPTNSYASENSTFHICTGRIGYGVGNNGVLLNISQGLAAMPHNIECDDPGRKIRLSDIYLQNLDNSDYQIDIEIDGKKERRVLNSSFNAREFPPDLEVIIYDGTCRNPFCKKHSITIGAPGFEDNIDVLEVYCDILDISQEDANLKLKKAMRKLKRISTPRPSDPYVTPKKFIPASNASKEELGKQTYDAIMEFRKEMKEYLKPSLDGELGAFDRDLGEGFITISERQAKAIAKLSAYTAEVVYVDQDNNTVTKIIALKDIMEGNDAFTFPDSIDYKKIVSIAPFYTSYETLNQKAIHDVANDSFNPDPSKKRKIDTTIMRATLAKSSEDWSAYQADSINVGDILKATPAKRFAFPTQFIPMDSPTAKQRLLRELGRDDDSISSMIYDHVQNIPESTHKHIVENSNRLLGGKVDAIVTKVQFAKGFMTDNATRDIQFKKLTDYSDQNLNNANDPKHFGIEGYSAAYVFVGSQQDVNELFSKKTTEPFKYDCIITNYKPKNATVDQTVEIDGRTFYVIGTKWERKQAWAKDKTFSYPWKERSIDNYVAVYFDDDLHGHMAFPDSGGSATQSVMDDCFRKVASKDYKMKLEWDRYINNPSNAELVNVNEYKDLLDSLNNNDGKVELHVDGYRDKIHSRNVKDFSLRFLEAASSNKRIMNKTSKQWKDGAIQLGTVFGFVKKTELGVTHLYPLMFTGKQSKMISNVSGIEISGDIVTIHKYSEVTIGPNDSTKGYINWEPYKGMISIIDDERSKIAPTVEGLDGSFDKYIYYDGKSREKRLSTKGKMVYTLNCWGFSRMRPSSIRSENYRNKNKKFSTWAEDSNNAQGKRNIDILFDSASNHRNWKLIADGTETLFENVPDNKLLNNAIRKLAHSSVYGNAAPLSILFESHEYNSIEQTDGEFKPRDCDEIFGLLNILNFDEIKAVFNAMDPAITSDPMDFSSNRQDPGTLVRDDGQMMWRFPGVNGETKPSYGPGRIIVPNFTDDTTNVGQGLGSAVLGKQSVNKIALRHGMRQQDEQNFLDAILASAGEDVQWDKTDLSETLNSINEDMELHPNATSNLNVDEVNGRWGYLSSRKQRTDSIYNVKKNYESIGMQVIRYEGGEAKPINLKSDKEFQSIKSTFVQAFGCKDLSDLQFLNQVKICTGWSTQLGVGDQQVDINHIQTAVDVMTSRLDQPNTFYIPGGIYGDKANRVSIPLGPKGDMRDFYDKSAVLKKKYPEFNDFVKAATRELDLSIKAIAEIKYFDGHVVGLKQEKQKAALMNMVMYSQLTHGQEIDTNQLYAGGFTVYDLFDMDDKVQQAFMTDKEKEDLKKIDMQIDRAVESYKVMEKKTRDRGLIRIDNHSALAGFSALVKGSDPTLTTKILGRAESAIRLFAVSNPLLVVPNAIESVGHTLIAKVGMSLPIGPYSQKSAIDKDLVSKVAQDEKAFKLYKILSMAQLMNLNEELIVGLNDADGDLDAFIDDVYGGRGPLGKVSDFVFRITSGQDISQRWQFELFIERMGQLVVAEDIRTETMVLEQGVDEDGNKYEYSAMQLNLMNNPAGWMAKCLMSNNPARGTFLRALNFSEGAAMARDTCVSIFLDELFKNHKVASFLNTCCGSTFYRYASNFTGRILNWVMPISSINYILIEKLKGIPSLEHLGLERAQIHTSLKAACIADAMHLSIPALAILIATGLGAALQPPEDKDKANDYREYTFFGMRIAEEWWLSDIMGPALPMACFIKSCIDQKPRLDVLVQGMGTVLANNPLMKVGDLVELITNQDALWDELNDEKENYENAFGGAPTTVEQWMARSGKYFLTCFGRMITPSILREWQNNTLRYEKSYKKIYAEGVSGINAEEGQIADTVNTTYQDAMLRQVTRNNPMLGFICDIMFRPSTSYVAGGTWIQGMPNVVIDDTYQRYSMKEYSINEVDENGEYVKDSKGRFVEKSEDEKQKVAFNVIATLESTDDMSELYNQGFMIDSQTRAYVSDIIWSMVQQKREQFNEIANSEEFSAYSLGGGDYWAGRKLRSEMFQSYYDDINYLQYTLFRDKLWSYEMRKGVQKYIRENVTYRQDAKGNWYASGTPKTDLNMSGFAISPGTTDSFFTSANDEGTMGWENDWATPSAVTGESMYDRSLIALNAETDEVPDFDSWGEQRSLDDNGKTTQSSNQNNSNAPTVTNNPYDTEIINSKSGGKSGGSGGGSRRRSGGGGGGGGSVPNIYSRLPNLNISSPKTTKSSRLYDTNFDYLRPSFETKGSREANKRSDI